MASASPLVHQPEPAVGLIRTTGHPTRLHPDLEKLGMPLRQLWDVPLLRSMMNGCFAPPLGISGHPCASIQVCFKPHQYILLRYTAGCHVHARYVSMLYLSMPSFSMADWKHPGAARCVCPGECAAGG